MTVESLWCPAGRTGYLLSKLLLRVVRGPPQSLGYKSTRVKGSRRLRGAADTPALRAGAEKPEDDGNAVSQCPEPRGRTAPPVVPLPPSCSQSVESCHLAKETYGKVPHLFPQSRQNKGEIGAERQEVDERTWPRCPGSCCKPWVSEQRQAGVRRSICSPVALCGGGFLIDLHTKFNNCHTLGPFPFVHPHAFFNNEACACFRASNIAPPCPWIHQLSHSQKT